MAKNEEKNPASSDGFNWAKIRSEYVTKKITYKQLCEKYGCSMSVLTKKASAEKWADARKKHRKKVERKTEEKIAGREAEKNARDITRCVDLANTLLAKVEKAIDELDKHIIKNHTIMKIDMKGEGGSNVQTVNKSEKIKTVDSIIKTDDLKRLSATLKDIKDVLIAGEEGDNEIRVIFEDDILKKYGA